MTRKAKKRVVALAALALTLTAVLPALIWGNSALMQTVYTLTDDRLPEAFDGFRIAQVSDLHNSEMGRDNGKLLELLRDASPDIITITGDLVDSEHSEHTLAFVREAVRIAPCYYVTGNHEASLPGDGLYEALETELIDRGVRVLHGESVDLVREGETITLAGVDDPKFVDRMGGHGLGELERTGHYTVLLSHRPELFEEYVRGHFDLVLTGHAHGGQVRLPFVGGLVAPGQGLFPKYDSGLYTDGDTDMIVSRGIGNSILPLRIANRPELVLVELRTA